jgi:hypothetical protein
MLSARRASFSLLVALAACAGPQKHGERAASAEPCKPTAVAKPRLKEPDCLVAQIVRRLDATGRRPTGRHVVKFRVRPDGRPDSFTLESAVSPGLEEVLASSAQACEFEAGHDACGRPMTMWLVAPIDFKN